MKQHLTKDKLLGLRVRKTKKKKEYQVASVDRKVLHTPSGEEAGAII